MKRRAFFFAVGGLAVALLLFATLVVAVAYGWQREWLRREVEARLAVALQLPVSIGSIEGPLHRDVSLRALRIGDPSAPLLEMDALRVQLGTLQRVGVPTLLVSRIDLLRPRLHLRRGLDGRWPWQTLEGEDAAPSAAWPLALVVDSLVLDGGIVEINDGDEVLLRGEFDASLDGTQLGAGFALGELRLSFAVNRPAATADAAIAGSLEASYSEERFESVVLRAKGPGFDAQVRGSGTLDEIEQVALSVRIASLDAFDEWLLGDELAVSGSVSLSADLRGALRWPIGTVVVDAADLHTADFQLGALRLELVSEREGRLRVDDLHLEGGLLEVSAEPGALLLFDENQTALRGLELHGNGGKSALKIDLETSSIGSRGLDALLHDAATRVAVEAKAWPLGALAPLWRLVDVEVAGLLDAELTLTGAEPEPQLRGSLQLQSGDLRFSDAEALGVQLKVEVDGTLLAPRGRLAATAKAIRWADTPLGALRLELVSERAGMLRVDALQLEGGLLEVSAEPGALILSDETRIALRGLELHGSDNNGALKIDFETSPAGSRGLDALLHDAATRVALEAKAWPLGTFAPLWSLVDLEVAGLLDADLALTGAEPEPQLRGSLQLQSGDLRFSDAEALGVQLKVEVDGTLPAPRGRLAGSAESIRWADAPLGALRVAFEIPDGRTAEVEAFALRGGPVSLRVGPGSRLRVDRAGLAFEDFDLQLEDQRLRISGWVSESAAEKFRLGFPSLDAARLAQIETALSGSALAVEVAGQVGGQLEWDGPLADPTLTGQLRWSNAQIGELVFDRIEAGVGTENAVVQIDSRWTYQGRASLDAGAALPAGRILTDPAALLDDPRASLRLRADRFELASLARFLPSAISDLAGSLTADLRATGGPFPANASGQLSIERGAATLRALGGQKLSPIFARASLAGEQIRLDGFQIGEEKSRVHGTGELRLSRRRPGAIDLHLVFENYAIDAPGLVKGTLDGPVDLTGTADAPELRGQLELSGLRVQIPEVDSVELKEIRVVSADGNDTDAGLREGETALLDLLHMDIDVAVRRNSWARGRGADVELQGDLAARKDPGRPLALSGEFKTVRGTYQIYGRRFRIARGEVLFDGAEEVDPVLEIRAEHKVRDVKIFALLEGRLSEPSLRFESDPELSETDIASYLILGRAAADAGGGEQPALDAVAAQIAAGAALSEFERLFGGALPVDLLDVRMESEGEKAEVRAGVGKYVGERLFLHYEHGFGDAAEDELRAEYELTPNWSVESSVSTDDEVGADLIFEFEH